MGNGGGLALFWDNIVDISLINYSPRHIHVQVAHHNNSPSWFFTGFYGHPVANNRMESWDLLRLLSKASLPLGLSLVILMKSYISLRSKVVLEDLRNRL